MLALKKLFQLLHQLIKKPQICCGQIGGPLVNCAKGNSNTVKINLGKAGKLNGDTAHAVN
jgi:hypothetical protein